jgi:hypothetical protein
MSMKNDAGRQGRVLGALILLLLGSGAGGLIALSPDIGLPLIVLLLPGLVYLLLDRSPGWAVARAILLFQAAACVHPIFQAWYQCAGIDSCMSQLAAVSVIFRVWLAGTSAWLLTQLLPTGLEVLNNIRLRRYRATLEARRVALNNEWRIGQPAPE